jgi:UPF0755 protein
MADSISLINSFLDKDFLNEKGFNSSNALVMYMSNTYECYWDISPIDFRNKTWKSYNAFWNKTRIQKAKDQNLTPIEVIILASIVQKESVQISEKPLIAGVYLNRLKKNIKLQADPTVIYALKNKLNNFDTIIKRVLYKDLKIKSPHNTYLNKGLPPSPICTPDISSINAVLNPEKHLYLFFVSNPKKPGFHLFAKNFVEHNKNKNIYTDWLNKKKIYR